MQLDVCVCLCVPDSKQERQGPAFLYDGFDHSPEPVYRHPDIRDKKIIPPSWFQKKITSTPATRDSQVIFRISLSTRASNIPGGHSGTPLPTMGRPQISCAIPLPPSPADSLSLPPPPCRTRIHETWQNGLIRRKKLTSGNMMETFLDWFMMKPSAQSLFALRM